MPWVEIVSIKESVMTRAIDWTAIYNEKEALWIHDGNPRRPHALLTSGMHSDGFFDSGLVMEDPDLLDYATRDLLELLKRSRLQPSGVDRVIGPAMGAITLAHDLARHNGRMSLRPCLCGYTEKSEDGKSMILTRIKLRPGERVLLVEDVLTTGSSIEMTAKAVMDAGGIVLPLVGALVNRSGFSEVSGRKIVSLIDRAMPIWPAAECPLCKQGSEALRPKGENWPKLNAAYRRKS